MQCTFHQWMLLNKSSNRTYIYFNSELRFCFTQDQQYLQNFFDISIFTTTFLNRAAKKLLRKKVFVKTMKELVQK